MTMRQALDSEDGYVSNYLTHFVGRARNPIEQYVLLKKVLSSGWLCHAPFREAPTLGIRLHPKRRFSDNDMVVPEMICFCDIPLPHLRIHTLKYSQFGIAFPKSYLVSQGASPVLYVAKNSGVLMKKPEFRKPAAKETLTADEYALREAEAMNPDHYAFEPRGERFEQYMAAFWDLWYAKQPFEEGEAGPEVAALMLRDRELWMFAMPHLLGYVKFFDDSLALDHVDNYYMEREWRRLGNLQFEPANVAAVLVPPELVDRCRTDCEEYADRVHTLPLWEAKSDGAGG